MKSPREQHSHAPLPGFREPGAAQLLYRLPRIALRRHLQRIGKHPPHDALEHLARFRLPHLGIRIIVLWPERECILKHIHVGYHSE